MELISCFIKKINQKSNEIVLSIFVCARIEAANTGNEILFAHLQRKIWTDCTLFKRSVACVFVSSISYTLYTQHMCWCAGNGDAVSACIEQRQMDGIIQGQTLIVCNSRIFVSPSLYRSPSLSFIRCIQLLSKSISHTKAITCECKCQIESRKGKCGCVPCITHLHLHTHTSSTRTKSKRTTEQGSTVYKGNATEWEH